MEFAHENGIILKVRYLYLNNQTFVSDTETFLHVDHCTCFLQDFIHQVY